MKILIAVDGSPYTQQALAYLAAHRSTFVEGHQLVVLHVSSALPSNVKRHVTKDVVEGYYSEEGEKIVGPVKAFFAQHGVNDYAVEHREGHAAEEIVAAAKELGAELIVMGTRGHGAIGRALVGSVATSVISDSDIAVMLVK
jgi:nucleotide-binding universal stress UspA family protein